MFVIIHSLLSSASFPVATSIRGVGLSVFIAVVVLYSLPLSFFVVHQSFGPVS